MIRQNHVFYSTNTSRKTTNDDLNTRFVQTVSQGCYGLCIFRHVFLVEKCRLWGVWEIDWMVKVDDIMAVPTLDRDKLIFKVRQVIKTIIKYYGCTLF